MKKKEHSVIGSEFISALEESLDHVKEKKKLKTSGYSIHELPKIESE